MMDKYDIFSLIRIVLLNVHFLNVHFIVAFLHVPKCGSEYRIKRQDDRDNSKGCHLFSSNPSKRLVCGSYGSVDNVTGVHL